MGATGVDLSGAIGEKLGDATLTEDNVKEMEEGMMAIMEGFAEAGEGGCLPLNSNTYSEDGAAADCVTNNLLDPDAQAECLKYAGKDCENEDEVPAEEKDACLSHSSAKTLVAGAIALVATVALM